MPTRRSAVRNEEGRTRSLILTGNPAPADHAMPSLGATFVVTARGFGKPRDEVAARSALKRLLERGSLRRRLRKRHFGECLTRRGALQRHHVREVPNVEQSAAQNQIHAQQISELRPRQGRM